ncbi:hypothetical protein EJ05DRAFT_253186 [Pseudovirgaria hyperparasitica]|uniref:Uncharacterized protein n=1 Tax=Pseudovirgaria hyperparasitica TaxID=470096 RepID=A0A6A6WHI1_9PEZI|nr:uncharacterized protein EJ05DRAFT_253186 [Pseudovirgaria hyperparasitica]KAF2761107.1 hypothetical protein EJ05DRAFT_253186 [Pseudovirgaria hyperparasitica]
MSLAPQAASSIRSISSLAHLSLVIPCNSHFTSTTLFFYCNSQFSCKDTPTAPKAIRPRIILVRTSNCNTLQPRTCRKRIGYNLPISSAVAFGLTS